MDKETLKQSLLTAIEVIQEVEQETGVTLMDAGTVVRMAISAFIESSRNGHNGAGNGNGKSKSTEAVSEKHAVIGFGKYKNRTILEVLKLNKSYILWLSEKSTNAALRRECQNLLALHPTIATKTNVAIPVPHSVQH
ncbi:MAG: hypothetical protein A2252_09675 [Elusimicrobia bacterium RIFOXYA2_FULL_39_19]|nr:MAG: hypothetical protein A2252_09675 [Elusimicrobia bacterium RIFOXYA2_FULL_39_19]